MRSGCFQPGLEGGVFLKFRSAHILTLACTGILSICLLVACSIQTGNGSLTTWSEATNTPETPVFPSEEILPTPNEQFSAPDSTEASETSPTAIPKQPTEVARIPTATATVPAELRIAVIGDYGSGDSNAGDVARLVSSWNPDFILTLGDNNYPSGAAETIDQNIGAFYHQYITPYAGQYGPGADRLRYFPTLGNHDWDTDRGQAYLDYFELPGNERYYDFTWGPVHVFAVSSDSREPDGVSRRSVQAQWLKERLATSDRPWKLVIFHQSPYSSGLQGSVDWMRWPFQDWGASAVLSGHDHIYERLEVDGIPYFVNGLGGGEIYYFTSVLEESKVRYSDDYGAILIIANETRIHFEFITRSGEVIDKYEIIR